MTPPSRSLIRELSPIAARQHGIFTRGQALEVGATTRVVDRRLETGLVHVCDDLVRRRLTTPVEMLAVLERLGSRRRGSGRARRVLELRLTGGDVPESTLETELDALLRRFGLPRPERQHVVVDGDRFVARLDFAYVDLRVNVEVDSREWHGSIAARTRDQRRDADLGRLGWIVLRFTTWDIRYRPEWIATEIATALRRRDRAQP